MAFDLEDFTKKAYPLSSDYLNGFLVACTSFGLIDFNNKGTIITVTNIDPLILSSIEKETNKQADRDENWKEMIVSLNNYFE